MIKLNLNENPYPPCEAVVNAAVQGLKEINRYSDLKYFEELRELLAEYNNISKSRIFLSPGSEFLLREIINIFSKDRKMIMVHPTFFPALEHATKNARKIIKYKLSPPEFKVNHDVLLHELDGPTLLVMDNPNNPTGKRLFDRTFIEEIVQRDDVLLLVDEAYYEFSAYSLADLTEKYPNIAIARTMDKAFSLAGLRLGYLIAGDYFIEKLYNFPKFLSAPALMAAIESLKNLEHVHKTIEQILKEKKRMEEGLGKLGIEVFSSETNFLLIRCKIPGFAEKLNTKGILIKELSGDWLDSFYRISIGLPEENDVLLRAIHNITAEDDTFMH